MLGLCGLCGEQANLQDSHFMPRALYKILRDDTGSGNPNPHVVLRDFHQQTSTQMKDYFLCRDCEQRFNMRGEAWVMRSCYRGRQTFRLRELLLTSAPYVWADTTSVIATADIADIDVHKLVYFAVSVVWRAAAHKWKLRGASHPCLGLGPYKELLRRFLLGHAAFPDSASLLLWVSSLTTPVLAARFPRTHRWRGCHVHSFNMPGLHFQLALGRAIDGSLHRACLLRGYKNPVFLSDQTEVRLTDAMVKHLRRVSQ